MAIGKKSSGKTIKNWNDNLHNSQQRFALHLQFAKLAKKIYIENFKKRPRATICQYNPEPQFAKNDPERQFAKLTK